MVWRFFLYSSRTLLVKSPGEPHAADGTIEETSTAKAAGHRTNGNDDEDDIGDKCVFKNYPIEKYQRNIVIW